ncbi:SOS response-associated peptidase [Limnoglobus roseus]|uniref:Abasic site processing protein n=2 Tax=Limnoglobus roseus TaxID=2598579 RepID=A0A5C1A6A0_9BACT|nr:SOS response-associated peptidase [Limnoglobus roseus]
MAGLWECWKDGTTKIFTCCSITTEPNDVLRPFHDRMPVIVRPENFTEWLAAETSEKRLRELLKPYPASEMEAFPVSGHVSKVTNEGPKCLEPLAA